MTPKHEEVVRLAVQSGGDSVAHRQGENMTDIHTCSYHCHRPECIKAQRDQMRDWIMDTLGAERFIEMMVYTKEEAK